MVNTLVLYLPYRIQSLLSFDNAPSKPLSRIQNLFAWFYLVWCRMWVKDQVLHIFWPVFDKMFLVCRSYGEIVFTTVCVTKYHAGIRVRDQTLLRRHTAVWLIKFRKSRSLFHGVMGYEIIEYEIIWRKVPQELLCELWSDLSKVQPYILCKLFRARATFE